MAQTDIVSGIFTKKLVNSTWTVLAEWGLTEISLLLTSGAATVNGGVTAAGEASAAIDMAVNVPFTIRGAFNAPIGGLVVTASAGTVQIAAAK